jgi:hypothetical protein
MGDDDLLRLLAYDGRRYWLENGWSLRFRIRRAEASEGRPAGVKYSFTLHDAAGIRLLGYDNAHGVKGREAFDHRHRFRRTGELVAYDYVDGDTLLVDFCLEVERMCGGEGVAFRVVEEDVDLDDHEDEENEDG